ncbi:MAG: RHS repeat protein, partial [Myxococcus sp.]|nr:RHS repeat protein [Myxococcus sp.]
MAQRTGDPLWVHDLEAAAELANDPGVPGLFAQLQYPQDLQGRYWVVVDEPGIDASDRYMIGTKFSLAIIDLNIPKSQWYGALARAARRFNSQLGAGRCCGGERVCEGVGGIGPCGDSMCAAPDGTRTEYVDPSTLASYKGHLGRAPVTTTSWLNGKLQFPTFCLPKLIPGCAAAGGACGFGIEINPSGRWDVTRETPNCKGGNTVTNVSGREVPVECTYANFGGTVWAPGTPGTSGRITAPGTPMADCDGRCFGCEAANGAVDSNGRPRFCALLRPVPGGGACDATDATRAMQQVDAQARWVANGANTFGFGNTHCDPPNSNGVRSCLTCANNVCTPTIVVDGITPDEQLSRPCQLSACSPGTLRPGQAAPTGPELKVTTGGSPGMGRAATSRPPVSTNGVGQTIDTVEGPVPPPQAEPKTPKSNGLPTDKDPNNANGEEPTKMVNQHEAVGGDPIALMSGSLEVSHTDLSFPGPVRSLDFVRRYSSQGVDRSELGSNWAHNWDVRVIPLRHENLPAGVDPYCAGTPADVTCVMLRAGNTARLYMRDRRDGLYKPQAGSFSTLLKAPDGWYLRAPDFHVQRFDLDGYLVYDADRFGNAFALEYELNAWGRLDEALCPNAVLRLDPQPGSWTDAMGPVYPASSLPCTLLSGLVGRTKPMVKSGTLLDATNFGLPPNPSAQLLAARELLFASQTGGAGSASVWGQRKKRVTRVYEVNDQGTAGRSLTFTYYPDSDTTLLPGTTTLRRAGLLQRVAGPAGSTVDFSYVAPALPARLNEALLSDVVRADTNGTQPAGVVAGPTRTWRFSYSSASIPGTTMTAVQVADLRRRYNDYFNSSYNCAYVRFDACGNGLVPSFMALGNEEVERRVDAFLSDVADNLLTIGGPNEKVETRYQVNPLALDFDKALAQRWGSTRVTGSGSLSPNWTTTLPEASLAYADEGPDGTDAFLDPAVAARYGYEAVIPEVVSDANRRNLLLPPDTIQPINRTGVGLLTQGTAAGAKPCDTSMEPAYRTSLPGYRKSYDYYGLQLATPPAPGALTNGLLTPGVDLAMTLKRSRLSCAQLAEAQTWDARHNDLQTVFTGRNPDGSFATHSFSGRRAEMNLNSNRLCAWTKFTDRDGVQHVYGFNYHGRPLVDAVKVGTSWKFAETLYNADGNVISQRRVMDQAAPWSPAQGDTRYGYVEGQFVGSAFQEPSPWYWSQRGNVITVLETPRGGSVVEEIEGTSNTETTVARYTEFFYEPLFSQLSKVISGDVSNAVRRAQRETNLFYDYQECAPSEPACLEPLLKHAQTWGAQLPVNSAGQVVTTGNPLSVPTDLGDLNGDGVRGFPSRGTLARVVTTAGSATETSFYRFSAHGKPYFLQAPDGRVTMLDYLPFGALSGAGHGNERGLLARVRVLRDLARSATFGPPVAPCPSLPGPYQWLLPAGCGNRRLAEQLQTQAGLSAALAAEIERQSTPGAAAVTAFTWTELGAPSKVVHPDGSETRYVRDVDGRVREEALYESPGQLHSRTVVTRNVQGLPTRTQRLSRLGVDLGSMVQDWDEEGRLLYECAEAVAGGCVTGAYGALPTGGTSRTLWYSSEGRVVSEMDAEGAYTHTVRDARGWVAQVRRAAAAELDRKTALTWSDDGELLSRVEGPMGAPVRTEAREHDGFGRLRAVTDAQGRRTEVFHSARDVVSSARTNGTAWTTRYVRDAFGRVIEQYTNGQRTLQLSRLPGGRVWYRQALGSEPAYTTYDDFGRAVFQRHGEVTSVRVAPADARFSGSALVRNGKGTGPGLLTTNVAQTLGALGEVLSETESGFDATSTPPSRTSTFRYDDNGALLNTTDAVGATSEYVRDFLGRSTTLRVTVNPGVVKTTSYTYNRRGQLTTLTDPRGSGAVFGTTVQTYTGYGEPKTRTVPGGTASAPSDVVATWEYDVVGRLYRETMGPARLRYQYTNDRLWRIVNDAQDAVLREYTYDGLGRLSTATNFNRGLAGLVADAERPVVTGFGYDTLGRRTTETSRVGTRAQRATTSTWTTTAGGTWQRQVARPDALAQTEAYDGLGRLTAMARPWQGRVSQWEYLGELGVHEGHDIGL